MNSGGESPMATTLKTRVTHLHATTDTWNNTYPEWIPKAGELVIYDADDTNPQRFKLGDGETLLKDLPFYTNDLTLDLGTIDGGEISGYPTKEPVINGED